MAPATTGASQLACPPLLWPRPAALAELALASSNSLRSPRHFSFRFVRLSSVFLFSACFSWGFLFLRVSFLVFISFNCDIYTQMNGVLLLFVCFFKPHPRILFH